MGSTCTSLISTVSVCAPPLTTCSCTSPWWPTCWYTRYKSRADTETVLVSRPGPYKTAGMRPARRSLRASPFPVLVRSSTVSVASCMLRPPSPGCSPIAVSHLKQLAHGNLLENAANRFGEQWCDGKRANLGHPLMHRQRYGVGDDDFFDGRSLQPFGTGVRQHGMGGASVHFLGAVGEQRLGGLHQGPARVDDVVDQDGGHALHVADDVHDLGLVGPRAALIDDGQRSVQPLGELSRAGDAAH